MCADEFLRGAPFLFQKRRLAQLGIQMHLFIARDAIHLPGVLVINRIVSHPQFERKIRADRNKSMEPNGIADGPGSTNKDCQGNPKHNITTSPQLRGTHPKINPEKQKRENGTESGMYQQAEAPEQSIQNETPPAGIIGQAKSSPEETDRQQSGKRGIPDPFKGYEDSAGQHRPP